MSKLKEYMRDLKDGWIHNSHLANWRWCPRYFKLRYIEGEVTPETRVMMVGTVFHDFCKRFHDTFEIYQFEEFSRLSDLIAWVISVIHHQESDLPNVLKMYIERFIVFECRRYWYYCRTFANADEEYIPHKTELTMRHRSGDEQYGRMGTVDVIFRTKVDGVTHIRLREYKVSRKPDISKIRSQLCFYKSIIEKLELFGKNVTYRYELYDPILDNNVFPLEVGSFERTRTGIHTPYWFYERPLKTTETWLEKYWKNFIEALESGFYPKQKREQIDYTCVYCNFYSLCWGRF
ncbi:hypothetical protein LCGC14_1198450 [marine sediment metagenome]|uniref:PD-(D/E)XK endonuclease-like domain-containing protein n=1 Tax=marine sediment metagenome TaxID=412755 RepID=A0A0F9LHM7_9ZZZZ